MNVKNLCSNRTFMELKFASYTSLAVAISRSNRTFMELKYSLARSSNISVMVLIVPLWN